MKKLLPLLLALLLLGACAPPPSAAAAPPAPAASDAAPSLAVHFVDVGQGDCILIACGGENMLIDAGFASEGGNVAAYLAQNGVTRLKYVVGTHAHEDHMGGLAAVIDSVEIGALLVSGSFSDAACVQRAEEAAARQGVGPTAPKAGDVFSLGGAVLTLLGPVEDSSETNNTSLVFRLDFGDVRFLFTGDAERGELNDILDSGALVRADVLKISHHGSSNGTTYRFLDAVLPAWAVIAVGAGNDYGHPHAETMELLGQEGCGILRTDLNGTVVFKGDGKTLEVSAEKGEIPSPAASPAPAAYIGNVNSKVFHSPGCASLPSEKNRVYFDDYDEALNAGYRPHSCLG